jgi:hypothetical protein
LTKSPDLNFAIELPTLFILLLILLLLATAAAMKSKMRVRACYTVTSSDFVNGPVARRMPQKSALDLWPALA